LKAIEVVEVIEQKFIISVQCFVSYRVDSKKRRKF